MTGVTGPIEIYMEVGEKRAFASAVGWPGWSRGGRTADDAVGALLASAARYSEVANRARAGFTSPKSVDDFAVVAWLKGDAGTEFGIPGQPAPGDDQGLDPGELKRWEKLLRAAWAAWDSAADAAEGITLTVGPRGGGRTLVKMTTHVLEAEQAYLRKLGSKPPSGEDMTVLREAAVKALQARARNESPPNPNQVKKLWSPRYNVRRSAWHALDHAWELEDRSRPI